LPANFRKDRPSWVHIVRQKTLKKSATSNHNTDFPAGNNAN